MNKIFKHGDGCAISTEGRGDMDYIYVECPENTTKIARLSSTIPSKNIETSSIADFFEENKIAIISVSGIFLLIMLVFLIKKAHGLYGEYLVKEEQKKFLKSTINLV